MTIDMRFGRPLGAKSAAHGRKLRSQLEALLQSQSNTAAHKLMSGAAVDNELHHIEQIQSLLKFLTPANTATIFFAGAVAVTCLVVACALWTIRLPTRVQMNLTTDSVIIGLTDGLNWSGSWDLSGGLLRVEGMSRVELPPELSRTPLLSGNAWLEISNGEFGLKHIELQPNAELSIKKGESEAVSINFSNAALLGQLEVFGKPLIQAGPSPEKTANLPATSFEIPGIVTFSHGAERTPGVLRVAPRSDLEFLDLAIRSISFAREEPDTSFRSGILSGKLTILSTGEEVPLGPGNRLRFDVVDGLISKLTIGPTGTTLDFEGKVNKASIGPSGFERELQPSLLEYLYHQQRLGFFWTVVTFLWGVLWSARTLAFK
ncbi:MULTISPECIES: hypothetical protein [unclassified Bradyrhizobium]|uniref:hypothetical protein n=1 Tax=unclassified Bradyrhizobium TaxID=2631580 RepID=UPI002916B7E5|nr:MULTISPECIES: hypothetical protein [unclassified Bradyrhizobium]